VHWISHEIQILGALVIPYPVKHVKLHVVPLNQYIIGVCRHAEHILAVDPVHAAQKAWHNLLININYLNPHLFVPTISSLLIVHDKVVLTALYVYFWINLLWNYL